MKELEEEFSPAQIEDFKNPEIDPLSKERRKKCLKRLAILIAIIVVIIIISIIIYKVTRKIHYEIETEFTTTRENEEIQIINYNAIKDIDVEIKINGKKKEKNTTYIIKKPGKIKVSFKFDEKLESLGSFFYGLDKLVSIDLSDINAAAFKNISRTFADCESLKKINFGKSKKKVIYMDEAFAGCTSLEKLDLSSFKTENTESMAGLFSGCHSLTSLDINHFNTSKVTSMDAMFSGCDLIESLNLTNFQFNSAKDISFMFSGCEKLTNIILGELNVTNLKRMTGTFSNCVSCLFF